jgi:hypothetical protein
MLNIQRWLNTDLILYQNSLNQFLSVTTSVGIPEDALIGAKLWSLCAVGIFVELGAVIGVPVVEGVAITGVFVGRSRQLLL